MNKYLPLLFVLIIILINRFYSKKNNTNPCELIYIKQDCFDYIVKKNVITKNDCINIINEATQFGLKNGWKEKRHKYYPTYDNQITKSWKVFPKIKYVINNFVKPYFSLKYKVDMKDIVTNEIFVVKYMMNKQRFLKEHKDGSEFSFILALNNNYKGGGTKLHYIDKIIKLNTSDILLFSGQHLHSGESITFGERWIVTGFLSYKCQNHCINYINNKY